MFREVFGIQAGLELPLRLSVAQGAFLEQPGFLSGVRLLTLVLLCVTPVQ